MKRKKLITYDPERLAGDQIRKPCTDCPWRRDSVRGWLGGGTPEEWVEGAHGEVKVQCHVYSDVQCAGFAIFQANVCKVPRDPTQLQLPEDRKLVFASSAEFLEHHGARKNVLSVKPSGAVILGRDPRECDGVYPRTRDGRCHGCGIRGEHSKRGA